VESRMNKIGGVIIACSVATVATTALGQERASDLVQGGGLSETRAVPMGLERGERQSSPLLTIGGVGVRVWAPVAPPYNALGSGSLAARNIWGTG
jgi:hypothetical protein